MQRIDPQPHNMWPSKKTRIFSKLYLETPLWISIRWCPCAYLFRHILCSKFQFPYTSDRNFTIIVRGRAYVVNLNFLQYFLWGINRRVSSKTALITSMKWQVSEGAKRSIFYYAKFNTHRSVLDPFGLILESPVSVGSFDPFLAL